MGKFTAGIGGLKTEGGIITPPGPVDKRKNTGHESCPPRPLSLVDFNHYPRPRLR